MSQRNGSRKPKATEAFHARARKTTPRAARRNWRPAYLAALAESGIYSRAAKAAGVGLTTVWEERQRNTEFARDEKHARGVSDMLLVDEAVRRARDGVRRMKFNPKTGFPYIDPSTGEPYVEHEYSDNLLAKLLASHMPRVYGQKIDVKAAVERVPMTLEEFRRRVNRTYCEPNNGQSRT